MPNNYLFDICFNFTSSVFRSDEQSVLERARIAGVSRFIITGSDVNDSEAAVQLCNKYSDGLYATAGIHPHLARQWNNNSYRDLFNLAQDENVVAVGEAGLDYNRNYSSRSEQLHALEQQIELACELQKPMFLHERDAHEDFFPILKEHRDRLPNAVVHCFTGEAKALYKYLDLDAHIGITGWICDERRGVHLQRLVRDIPEDRLMIETDAPYLIPRSLPQSPKNRRNEPCFLPHIADTIAKYRGQTATELVYHTTGNAIRFFNIGQQMEATITDQNSYSDKP